MSLLTIALAAITLGGCEENDLSITEEVVKTDTLVVETIKKEETNNLKIRADPTIWVEEKDLKINIPTLHPLPDYRLDKSLITKETERDLKYLAIGGSFASGVINGGYHNEGMTTAYPNLIARQLHIKDFQQPYFEENESFGTGKRELSNLNFTGGPVPKFAISKDRVNSFKAASNIDKIMNFSVPFVGRGGLGIRYNDVLESNYNEWKYLQRIINEDYQFGYSHYSKKEFDFYTLELGYDDLLLFLFHNRQDIATYASYANQATDVANFLSSYERRFVSYVSEKINKAQGKNIQGFIANVPNITEFPLLKSLSYEKFVKEFGVVHIYTAREGTSGTEYVRNNDYFLPTSTTDSLFGKNVNLKLKPGLKKDGPISNNNILWQGGGAIENLMMEANTHFENLSKQYGVHIVDLNALFSQVIKGEYITWDGVKADASPLTGNFFNEDGISLTPFAQSIVANAFLSKMNEVYKTEIPLVPTKYYLNLSQRAK